MCAGQLMCAVSPHLQAVSTSAVSTPPCHRNDRMVDTAHTAFMKQLLLHWAINGNFFLHLTFYSKFSITKIPFIYLKEIARNNSKSAWLVMVVKAFGL